MGSSARDSGGSPASREPSRPAGRRHHEGDVVRGRYTLHEAIGKGGMAVVYRATDTATATDVALKQLLVGIDEKRDESAASLFEREFGTLAQLSHPRIIEVYDYGVDDVGPFYTMELLDGGDLRERAPLTWKDVCRAGYDICSSLALIHSRRLIHRDVSPRNVRCTHDGQSKLIDFGAMVPMGAGSTIVGTPQFMAPEVVQRSTLDARTDLFSLGATLYYALTGRPPYAINQLSDAAVAWKIKPRPPSTFIPGIPEPLDALVLGLIAVEPSLRPRNAFEVMHRLAAIAGLSGAEPPEVPRAYLSTPVMVGRDETMERLTSEMRLAFHGHGRTILVEGAPGVGRSRVLDAAARVAETLGARVLRATGSALVLGAFGGAERLAMQLVEDMPELSLAAARAEGVDALLFQNDGGVSEQETAHPPAPKLRKIRASTTARYALQTALARWLLRVSVEQPLLLAVDDVHRLDEPSAALLAALATEAGSRPLLLLATTEAGAEATDRLAFDVLASRAAMVRIEPLSRDDSKRLFESIFGDVANVGVVSDGIHAIAAGNPRGSMDLAEHLVDRGTLRYERGIWTLPSRLDGSDLPRSAEDAIRTRIDALTPLSRWLVETQALATYRAFTRDDYATLRGDVAVADIDAALTELVSRQIVTSDGRVYSPSHRGWIAALGKRLPDEERSARHRALVGLYEGKLRLGVVHHALLGGLDERALDELSPILPGLAEVANLHEFTDLGVMEVAATFERALTAAERIGRSELELNHLRRWLAALSVGSDDRYYFRVAGAWLERLKRDSGYLLWEQNGDVADPGERLSGAMQAAFARYASTPESERVYRPDEAVRGLAHYVGISLAIGSSRLELSVTESLPALLEPFAPIAPLVFAVWQNAIAARESSCRSQWERARARWIDVNDRLGELEGTDPQMIGVFRRAVAYAIGANEATTGIASATRWADLLDTDPVQRVNALSIRRIVRLQQGDADGAEKLRKEAELLTLQARGRQMFAHLHWVELVACGMARDVTGVKECGDRIRALAKRSAGWAPYVELAEGIFRLCCDDLDAARAAFERTLALTEPRPEAPFPLASAWCIAAAGHVEALTGLGRLPEACAAGGRALEMCGKLEIGVASHPLARAVAVAEAKSGDSRGAILRLDALIRSQMELGITGLHLAASLEARTRAAPPLVSMSSFVDETLRMANDAGERARRALEVLCNAAGAPSGHLYLLADTGVRLAASLGQDDPPPGLEEFLRAYSAHGVDDAGATALFCNEAPVAATASVFVAPDGTRYSAILLTCLEHGEVRHAAVVGLALGHAVGGVNHEVSVAIGSHLIRVGDTTGVRA